MPIRRILTLLVVSSLAFAAPTRAQNLATQTSPNPATVQNTPTFAVISIKPAKPGALGSSSGFGNETFIATNVTLSKLIQFDAYGIPAPRIIGIPPALDKLAFDIQAKLDPSLYAGMQALGHDQRRDQKEKLVRQLLADQFKLVVHTETRELPVYALVVIKSGFKFQSAKDSNSNSISSRTGQYKATGITTADLANSLTRILSAELGRIVIDKTGLTGKYDLTLKWTPDTGSSPMLNGEPDTSAPSIFTAVQEQLGLKLESTKSPVPVLVIDHAEAPSED